MAYILVIEDEEMLRRTLRTRSVIERVQRVFAAGTRSS